MTNDTTPATDEQVEEIQLSYAHFNKIEIEDLAALCIRIYSDRARISALQSEITALRGLLGDIITNTNLFVEICNEHNRPVPIVISDIIAIASKGEL